MKKSSKKSTVKSKSKKRKNPLKKYQGGGGPVPATGVSMTPTAGQYGFGTGNLGSGGLNSGFNLGGDSYLPSSFTNFNTPYGGSTTTPSFSSDNLLNVSDPSYSGADLSLDTSLTAKPKSLLDYYSSGQAETDRANTADIMKAKYKPELGGPSKQEKDVAIAEGVAAGIAPGTGFITEALKKKTIDDPSRYYNKSTKKKLESFNKKKSAAKSASSVGQGLMATGATLASTGVGAIPGAIVTAIGGLVTGVSEGFYSGYDKEQGKVGADYDQLVADRQKLELRAAEQKKKNEAMNAQQYYNIPSAKTGGLMKYMAGGYQKVHGPSHEMGGVPIDLSGDGVVDSELEGGEIIEEMKHGGNASKKYIWSDHLKTGGMSFAKKFEKLRKGGARPGDIEKLRIEQELAAKRDPSKLYAKYGGMMHYMEEGGKLPKEVLESRLESHMSEGEAQNYLSEYKGGGLWANIHAKRKRIAGGSGEKMRKPGSKGAPTAKALIESKRDGGLKKYQTAGLAGPVQTAGPLATATPTAKTQFLNAMLASNRPAGTNPNLPVTTTATGTTPQKRVSRTDTGRFLAEYGAPLASVAGAAGDIGMTMSQKYTPVDPISARDVQAEQVFIDRAKDTRVGARESELIAAKRAIQQKIGSGQGQLNAARMISLRAQEEAAQNVYDQNRQASATEQQLNQRAMLEADIANQRKDLTTSESRRAESLRKQSFENMSKKYMGSVAGQLGNELASGMYKKEYINRTLPGGVDPYAINPSAYKEYRGKKNPATGEIWTPAEIQNDILERYFAETT